MLLPLYVATSADVMACTRLSTVMSTATAVSVIGIVRSCAESASLVVAVSVNVSPAAGVVMFVVTSYTSVVPTRVAAIGSVTPGTVNFTPVTEMSSVARACSFTLSVCAAGSVALSIGQSHAPFGTLGSFTPMYTTSVLFENVLPPKSFTVTTIGMFVSTFFAGTGICPDCTVHVPVAVLTRSALGGVTLMVLPS